MNKQLEVKNTFSKDNYMCIIKLKLLNEIQEKGKLQQEVIYLRGLLK